VLERVTLAQVVEFVVEMLVDLSRGTILDEKPAQNALATHPKNLTKIRTLSASPSTYFNSLSDEVHQRRDSFISDFVPWHPGVLSTFPLTETPVPADPTSSS
jgi:hypothetical protein